MYKCKMCGLEYSSPNGFGNHIKQFHKTETKDYYDLYLKKSKEGECKECGKETAFCGFVKGYRIHCSKSCSKKIQPNAVGWAWTQKEGYEPWNKGKSMNEEYKLNWEKGVKESSWGKNPWNKGKKMSEEHRKNWENSLKDTRFGKSPDEETRKKLRLNFIKKLNEIGKNFHPPYNKKGCMYFNQLIEEKGINIQHAENGGEFFIKELGYWVDGYDAENNVVYEWDEKEHYTGKGLREKDKKRQKEIEEFLKCEFIRIREDH